MKHVMLDLETFGTKPGVVLRSIGAVSFELDGTIGSKIYANIDRASCEAAGLTVDPRTEQWWSEQSKASQDALLVDPKPLYDIAVSFASWFDKQGALCIWGHGASFDPVIYEAAANAVNVEVPWKFWNVRDTRTVFDLFDFDTSGSKRDGVYHNALDDAVFQVKCLCAALKKGRDAAPASVFE